MKKTQKHNQSKQYPFIASCNTLSIHSPWRWLKKGLEDTLKAPLISLTFGIIMASMVMIIITTAWKLGSAWIMLLILSGLVFIAPLACIGTYAISAQIERNQPVSMKRALKAGFKRYIANELIFTLVLIVVFLIWARANSIISIFLPINPDFSLQDMTTYLVILSLVCLLFLSIIFAASVFSLPMIMHRDVDAMTAVVTSINATLKNKRVMLVWGTFIALTVILGILTAGLALVFLLPIIGHAAWHGYLETINAEPFPRHEVGITAKPRKK